MEAHRGGVPGVVHVIIGGVVGLPRGKLPPDLFFEGGGGNEMLAFVGKGVVHRLEFQVSLDGASEGSGFFVEDGRADEGEVIVGQLGHGVVGQSHASLRNPSY